MPINIKIEGLTAEQAKSLQEGLLKYYGPPPSIPGTNPEDPPVPRYTPNQWVTLCLWRDIKEKLKSVARREAEDSIRAAINSVDDNFGEDVV